LAGQQRPSLKDYLGWQLKHTHQRKKLSEAVFVTALGLPKEEVQKFERRAEREIRKARKKSGDHPKRKFAGSSWVHKRKKHKRDGKKRHEDKGEKKHKKKGGRVSRKKREEGK